MLIRSQVCSTQKTKLDPVQYFQTCLSSIFKRDLGAHIIMVLLQSLPHVILIHESGYYTLTDIVVLSFYGFQQHWEY